MMDKDKENIESNVPLVKEKSALRIDRNLGKNITLFSTFGEQNKAMVKSVVWYVSNQLKNQLFNEGIIDPHDFAKVMQYELNTLTTRHPSPACLQHLSDKEKALAYKKQDENPNDISCRVYDSWLENALYMLLNQNITFPSGAKSYIENGDTIQELTLESYRIFTKLVITFRQSPRGKPKILYEYTLDENFRNNLSLYYMKIDLPQANILRKKNLDDLYITMKNLRETTIFNQQLECESDIDFLCKLANINSESFSVKKKRLNKAFATLASIVDFTIQLKWKRGPQAKWANIPVVSFASNFSEIVPNRSETKMEKIEILYQNFISVIIAQIRKKRGIFYYDDNPNKPQLVLEYIKDRTACTGDELEEAYRKAQIRTFKEYSERSKRMFTIFYDTLPRMMDPEDIKKFFANPLSSNPRTKDELNKMYDTVIEITATEAAMDEKILKEKGFTVHTIVGSYYKCK